MTSAWLLPLYTVHFTFHIDSLKLIRTFQELVKERRCLGLEADVFDWTVTRRDVASGVEHWLEILTYSENTAANKSLWWKHWLFLWYGVVSRSLGCNCNVVLSLCFRGNHCSRFTVPILDHRHSSHAWRQEDGAFYNAPMIPSVTLKQRLSWRIISIVLHHCKQQTSYTCLFMYWISQLYMMPYKIFLLFTFAFDLCLCLIHFHAFV